jgi:hypothetical protein
LAAVSGTAFAQSTLAITGGVGVGLQKSKGDAVSQFTQTDGYLNFAVTEDLGGGMKVSASQQIAQNGRGGPVNAEDTALSLGGGFGTLKYQNINAGSNMVGSLANLPKDVNYALGGDAHVTHLSYTAPAYNGVTMSVASYQNKGLGTTPTLDTDTLFASKKSATAYKASYAQGPITGALEYRQHDGRIRVWGGYDLGMVKIDAATELSYKDNAKKKQSAIALVIPLSAITLGLHYGQKGNDKGTEAAAVYALSKRTNVNLSYGNLTRESADAGNGVGPFKGTSTRARLLHTF